MSRMVWHQSLMSLTAPVIWSNLGLIHLTRKGYGSGNDGWFAMESWGVTYFNEDTKEFDLDNEAVAELWM